MGSCVRCAPARGSCPRSTPCPRTSSTRSPTTWPRSTEAPLVPTQAKGVGGPEAQAEFAAGVNRMFDRIAGVYDRMNRTMTAGLDRRWRERAADRAELRLGERALD